jgi:endonuclease/exonuclease/phosphatase family metal-dependent hydrolase
MNVMTFNVRCDKSSDLENAWQNRKDFVLKMINFYDADILATQEVLKNQLHDLLEGLPQYKSLGIGRENGKDKGEHCAIFYKPQMFTIEKSGHFWLSEQPQQPGSKGWDGACERIVTWAIFKEKKTETRFVFFNTHFDHIGELARKESAILLKKKIEEIAENLLVILTGDLNLPPEAEVVKSLLEDDFLLDSRKTSSSVFGPPWSFHDFGRIPVPHRKLIDYILVDKRIRVDKYACIFETLNSVFLSDHNPVLVQIEFDS